jgi:hypothetical protein
MYGTVFRYRLKSGMEQQHVDLLKEFDTNPPEGFVGGWTYRLDSGAGEFMTAVSFADKDAYLQNANGPEQAEFFRRFRELLSQDVEWNDGEIVVIQGQQ